MDINIFSMKKLILLSLIALASCRCNKPSKNEQIKTLQSQVDSLKLEIIENWDFIESLKDEAKMARMEADYWGYKYDSVIHRLENENHK